MNFEVQDWGLIDFQEAWDRQKELVTAIQKGEQRSTLVLCSHPLVITMGRNSSYDNLVLPREEYDNRNIKVIDINRGGDVTLHNENQLVGYPIFNLNDFKPDLHWFLREIEEAIIKTVADVGIDSSRVDGLTGVWIENQRKICAIGLHCSRWVTSHGFALNVCNNVKDFDYIVPCGIDDKEVTSIKNEIGTDVDMNNIKNIVIEKFSELF
ncbi:MAG: lipoyl(octanoyl) transferase LipB [Candidatus Kapaibacterium sp.]|jgi:lipoyl(octanoyl) transferase